MATHVPRRENHTRWVGKHKGRRGRKGGEGGGDRTAGKRPGSTTTFGSCSGTSQSASPTKKSRSSTKRLRRRRSKATNSGGAWQACDSTSKYLVPPTNKPAMRSTLQHLTKWKAITSGATTYAENVRHAHAARGSSRSRESTKKRNTRPCCAAKRGGSGNKANRSPGDASGCSTGVHPHSRVWVVNSDATAEGAGRDCRESSSKDRREWDTSATARACDDVETRIENERTTQRECKTVSDGYTNTPASFNSPAEKLRTMWPSQNELSCPHNSEAPPPIVEGHSTLSAAATGKQERCCEGTGQWFV